MSEILISGYYGFQNSGDDSLLMAIIRDIQRENPDADILVLSSNPQETSMTYGVHAVNRLNFPRIMYEMFRAKLLVSGGGTLIQDSTSSKSLWYYLMVISLAKLFGMRIMLYANGIGPVNKPSNRKKTKKILNKVDLITLRDEISHKELSALGVTKPEIRITADPAFSLRPSPASVGEDILRRYGVDLQKKRLCISVRKWKTITPEWENTFAQAIDKIAARYDMIPIFLPMQLKKDYSISVRIAQKLSHPAVVLNEIYSTGDVLSLIGTMDLCIGMRLHTLIYSVSQRTPVIGLVYDPKIRGFLDYIHQQSYLPLDNVSVCTLCDMADKIMSRYDSLLSEMDIHREELKQKAYANAVCAAELLKKGRGGK